MSCNPRDSATPVADSGGGESSLTEATPACYSGTVSTLDLRVLTRRSTQMEHQRNDLHAPGGAAISDAELSPRQRAILKLIVHEYVSTGRPVGSKSLTERYPVG